MPADGLATTRVFVGALAAAPFVLLPVAHLVLPKDRALDGLASLAALLGLVALPVAWRVHASLRERGDRARASVVSLAITEGTALLGVVAYGLTGRLDPLIALAIHLVLAGAVWPREEG